MSSPRRPRIRRTGPWDWAQLSKRPAQTFSFRPPSSRPASRPGWLDRIESIRRRPAQRSNDDHVERALELHPDQLVLDRVGRRHLKWAGWILYCGHPDIYGKKSCRCRACPSCSKRIQQEYRTRILSKLEAMTNPVLYMARVYSHRIDDEGDLKETLDVLHEAFGKLYDRKIFRAARSAAGFIEVPPTADMRNWNVHLHVIIDIGPDGIDVQAADDAWQELIGPRPGRRARHGAFSIDAEVRDRERIAGYISKRASWSPEPGKLTPRLLRVLFAAIHGRHLLVSRRPRALSPG